MWKWTMNKRAYAALRRLTIVVYFPAVLVFATVMFPMALFTWIITGMDIDDQMDWFEMKNDDYWNWVKQ
jgi:hypothetical protein